ncbi:BAH_G0050330.mRNA.1.CDS.1 [Saccharomyces cerevisiae]|nr:SX2_G0034440.mRNA.1.CDS.1 [Saccharomyces cerevisiae]CAI4762932.1 BAH_G0050330.mRNA.1.CDS.1 [Saccharomyces cerevisiae]CAI4765284.1 BAG_1a_G0050320.mRNA.1.CDS.1 [Saccharomyces cerevisiae]CAI7326045.1 BAG_1a_G0050320.mRNA.1.CDS.1 [Saccharomyces cerevisiae]CAI7327703.1 BAH_G0050330.mRNA.1.CDS.1 [Saccharomyces cerevisiae]
MSTSTHSHKRKNSHLFPQRKSSNSSMDKPFFPNNDSVANTDPQSNENGHTINEIRPTEATIDVTDVPQTPFLQEQYSMRPRRESFQFNDIENQHHTYSFFSVNKFNRRWGEWSLPEKRSYVLVFTLIALSVLVLLVILIPSKLLPTKITRPKTSAGDSSLGKRSFSIENVLNGDFAIPEDTFHFIDPPQRLLGQDSDPGLYFTTKEIDGHTHFIAKQLFDETFEVNLGGNRFLYEGVEFTVSTVQINYKLDKLIFGTNLESEFRHSSKGFYWIKDLNTGNIEPILPPEKSDDNYELGLSKLSYAHFSPAYNYIYSVYENNLFLQQVNSGVAKKVTEDGSKDIFNAKPDWIYEEEVLASDQAIWWAPDDSKAVFARFNDTSVDDIRLNRYTNMNEAYLSDTKIKYPKPGFQNPQFDLFLVNLQNGIIYSINTGGQKDSILYNGKWISPDTFRFEITDRNSKILDVKVYDIPSSQMLTVRNTNSNLFNGWIEKTKDILSIPPKPELKRMDYGYIDIHADSRGFSHLFYYPTVFAKEPIQLTKGNWEVTGNGIVGYEYETDTIFFTANEIGVMSQHLYSSSLTDSTTQNTFQSLQNPSDKYDFYEFELSSSARYAISKKLGPDTPIKVAGPLTRVLNVGEIHDDSILQLTKDEKFKEKIKNYDLPITSYKTMVLDDGVEINYIEIKPANLNPKKKYPILVNIYGGPGSQTFTTKSSLAFEQAVVSGLDVIVLQIEPRGTGGKGWSFRSWAREKLGYWEPRDITEVTKKFIQRNSQHIDESKIAIWGWSYGGFTSLKTVELDNGGTFKYAMAVAPVTNWTLYDSVYTERYMNQPSENHEGYFEVSTIQNFKSFESLKRLFIVHGTFDDNVHIQNTFRLVDQLNLLGLTNYDMHIFPDSDHSIRYHNAQRIVFQKLYYWLGDAFAGRFDNTELLHL